MSDCGKVVEELVQRWFDALQTGDSDVVTQLYAPQAVLLPTLLAEINVGHPQIRQYFERVFVPRAPIGTIVKQFSRVLGGVATNSGIYSFSVLKVVNGQLSDEREDVSARFTFVYQWTGTDWLIVEHHSSALPAPPSYMAPAATAQRGKSTKKA